MDNTNLKTSTSRRTELRLSLPSLIIFSWSSRQRLIANAIHSNPCRKCCQPPPLHAVCTNLYYACCMRIHRRVYHLTKVVNQIICIGLCSCLSRYLFCPLQDGTQWGIECKDYDHATSLQVRLKVPSSVLDCVLMHM